MTPRTRFSPKRSGPLPFTKLGTRSVAFLSEHADPVAKITILPAGRALGVTEQLPVDERHLYSESYLHDSLAVRLGGRASENLVLGEASTGAASDLSSATQLAIKMITEWGLSTRLGPVGYGSTIPRTSTVRSSDGSVPTPKALNSSSTRR